MSRRPARFRQRLEFDASLTWRYRFNGRVRVVGPRAALDMPDALLLSGMSLDLRRITVGHERPTGVMHRYMLHLYPLDES